MQYLTGQTNSINSFRLGRADTKGHSALLSCRPTQTSRPKHSCLLSAKDCNNSFLSRASQDRLPLWDYSLLHTIMSLLSRRQKRKRRLKSCSESKKLFYFSLVLVVGFFYYYYCPLQWFVVTSYFQVFFIFTKARDCVKKEFRHKWIEHLLKEELLFQCDLISSEFCSLYADVSWQILHILC